MIKMGTIIPHRAIIGIEQVSYNKALGKVLFGVPRWRSGKESTCHCRRHRRHGFDPWVGKIPWNRKWQPTPVFLPGEFHGQKSLVGYSPWDCIEFMGSHRVGYNWATNTYHEINGKANNYSDFTLVFYLLSINKLQERYTENLKESSLKILCIKIWMLHEHLCLQKMLVREIKSGFFVLLGDQQLSSRF